MALIKIMHLENDDIEFLDHFSLHHFLHGEYDFFLSVMFERAIQFP